MRRAWVAVAAATGLELVALLIPSGALLAPRGQVALLAATAALHGATAAVAWSRYRRTQDPGILYVAIGFALLAVQVGAYGVVWPIGNRIPAPLTNGIPRGTSVSPYPVVAWQVAWIVAAACFVLVLPWRERRGRGPISAGLVTLAVIVDNALLEALALLVVAVFLSNDAVWVNVGAGLVNERFGLGPTGWLLGGLAAVLLGVAGAREAARADGRGSHHAWFAAAFVAASILQAGVIAHPLQGLGFLAWTDILQPVVPALVLAGILVSERAEHSRMRRATDRAAEVMDGRAEIASTLAHEVRSPVATIKSLASTTSQNYDRLSHAERREFVGLIEQEASRLLDTVGQASLALKVDAGTLVYDRRRLDLATAVREGIESAETAGHDLTAELAPGLIAAVDRMHLAEAVRQVVDNAAKFSPPDAPIRVTSAVNGEDALIEVADGGPGIPEERRDEVFERFARWRPAGYEDRPGAGLGLFISRAIVSEHGGDMVIDDAPGGGTIVQIRIPVEG